MSVIAGCEIQSAINNIHNVCEARTILQKKKIIDVKINIPEVLENVLTND